MHNRPLCVLHVLALALLIRDQVAAQGYSLNEAVGRMKVADGFDVTLVAGEPDARFSTIYDIVLTAQETAEATLEVGMSGSDTHMLAQNVIAEAGYGENFGHGLGHGVGLEIHEAPRLGRNSADRLDEGMVITVEPGIYLPGWGGVRIEDMGVLRNGKFESFTRAPKLRMIGA